MQTTKNDLRNKLIEAEEVPSCPVCNSLNSEERTVGFDYEIQTCSNLWRFVTCKLCHHVWLNPRPKLSTLSVIYPSTYYAYNYEKQINPIAIKGKEILDGFKIQSIIHYSTKKISSYLDIGCGNGRYLRIMEKKGIARSELYGIELDNEAVKPLSKEGYQVFCERVENCKNIPTGSIDLVTMFHVIEHVDNPSLVVRRVKELISPGGIFAIETPNIESLDANIFKSHYWGGYHIPRHWHLFTPGTLKKLLRDAGFEVIATCYQTGHYFWLVSFQHLLRYKYDQKLLAKIFDPFTLIGLPLLILFTLFDKLRAMFGFKTSAVLMIAKKT